MLTFKRAGALALVILLLPAGVEAGGWYLMEAPPQTYLDSSCRNGGWPTWRDYFSALRTSGKVPDARMYRSFVEMSTVASTAPLSQWMQLTAPSGTAVLEDQSAFKELKDCELARNAGTGMPPVHLGYSDITAWFDELDLEKLGDPELAKMVAKIDAEGAKTGSLSGPNGAEVDTLKKLLPTLEDFERKHPENYRVHAMIILFKDGLAATSPSARAGNERCIAAADPRLKEE